MRTKLSSSSNFQFEMSVPNLIKIQVVSEIKHADRTRSPHYALVFAVLFHECV